MNETSEQTKPCPVCGKNMIEVMSPFVLDIMPPIYSFDWCCYGCGHEEHSRNWREEYRDLDRERWERANPPTPPADTGA